MPLFPVLETETTVQANDKTRLDGSRSYASGVNAITVTEITPSAGVDQDAVDVSSVGYLDWEFPFELDVIEGENDAIDFSEGGGELTAILNEGTYSLAALAAEIQAQMLAVGGIYAVTVSEENKISIVGEAEFSLLPVSGSNSATSILPSIGFAEDVAGEEEYEGEEIERITKTVTLAVTNDATSPDTASKTATLEIISERADKLFSTDQKLKGRESDIMKYLEDGRSSFKNFHRAAQTLIFEWLDRQGYMDDFRDKLTKAAIVDVSEVQEWATMIALRLIFDSVSNTTDDVFFRKARGYEKMEAFYRDKAVLRLDLNQDGVVDLGENLDVQHAIVVRR
jgi:hypothetical protein